jgi:hypothetical protein
MTQNTISRKARWPGKRFAAVGALKDSKRFNPDPQPARTFADLPELFCFPGHIWQDSLWWRHPSQRFSVFIFTLE